MYRGTCVWTTWPESLHEIGIAMSRKLRPLARESDTAPFHINFKMFKCLYRYRELELHMLVWKTMITMMMTTTTVLLICLTTTKSFRRIVRAWTTHSARAMLSNPLYRRCLALWRHSAANLTTSSTQSVDTLVFSSSLSSSMIINRLTAMSKTSCRVFKDLAKSEVACCALTCWSSVEGVGQIQYFLKTVANSLTQVWKNH